MGITRRARSTTTIALACVLLMAGCSAEPADTGREPAPSASPSVSASATATTAPLAVPRPPLDGGCDGLAAVDGVEGIVGEVQRVTTQDALWQVAIETAGGLACSLLTTRAAVQVYVLPDALVTGRVAELTARSACEDTARAMECRASVASDGAVTLVAGTFGRGEDQDAALAVAADLAGAIAAGESPGAPAPERKTTWRKPLDCEQIAETLGITSILGSEKVRPFILPASAPRVENRLDQAVTATSRCDWSRMPSDDRDLGSRFSIVAVPGGAWAWKRLSAQIPDSAEATVAGFPARVTSRGDVYIADGVNLLHIEGSGLAGISVTDTSGGVLSVLNSPAPGAAGARD